MSVAGGEGAVPGVGALDRLRPRCREGRADAGRASTNRNCAERRASAGEDDVSDIDNAVGELTVAVKVTDCPTKEGDPEEFTTVVVFAGSALTISVSMLEGEICP
jgi:hypothetical protein